MAISNNQDPIKVERVFLTLFLTGLTVFLAWFGLTKGMPLIGLAIPAVAVLSWLLGRPEILLVVFLFADTAKLLLPGVTKAIGVPEVFQTLVIGWAFLDAAVRRKKRPYSFRRDMDPWMGIFALNMLLIMLTRGSGFRISGGSTYGGTGYLLLFLAIIFYFAAIRIDFPSRYMKTLLWSLFIASLIPAVTEILVAFSGGGFFWLTAFVDTSVEKILYEGSTEGGVQRWASVASVGTMLIPLAFVLCRKSWSLFFLFLVSLGLVAMSGFRGRILSTSVTLFCITLYNSKNRGRILIFWILAGLVGLGLLMVTAPMLPRAVQRAVSFIEFLPVDPDIVRRADNSSTWRFDLWRDYCIPNVPKYLLIGRGIAQDITGFAWLQANWYGSAEFYYHMGRYHSGPFSLLLDFGLAGTVSFTVFFLLALIDGWKTIRRVRSADPDPLVFRYYVYLTIITTYRFFAFYFIFGDVRESLPQMLVVVIQMRILKKNFLMESPLEGGVQTPDRLVEFIPPKAGIVKTVPGTSFKPVNRWARPGAAKR
jgi:hypothetical protein